MWSTSQPKLGSADFAKLTALKQEAILKAQNEALKSKNPNPKTTPKQPTPTEKQTKRFLDQIPALDKNASPIFTIDTKDSEENGPHRCLSFPTQISSDPFICLIPMSCLDEKGNGWDLFKFKRL